MSEAVPALARVTVRLEWLDGASAEYVFPRPGEPQMKLDETGPLDPGCFAGQLADLPPRRRFTLAIEVNPDHPALVTVKESSPSV